jgi:hypothetical protein
MISQKHGKHFQQSLPGFGTKREYSGQSPAFTPDRAHAIRCKPTCSRLLYQDFP